MSVYFRNILVKAYTAPDRKPTCRNLDGICIFYRTGKYDTIEECSFDGTQIKRKDGKNGEPEMGYTLITENCPVWCKKGKYA